MTHEKELRPFHDVIVEQLTSADPEVRESGLNSILDLLQRGIKIPTGHDDIATAIMTVVLDHSDPSCLEAEKIHHALEDLTIQKLEAAFKEKESR